MRDISIRYLSQDERIEIADPHREGLSVAEKLSERWSPQQIARHLRALYPEDSGMRLCHKSPYQAINQPGFKLARPAKVVPGTVQLLRTERDHGVLSRTRATASQVRSADAFDLIPADDGCA